MWYMCEAKEDLDDACLRRIAVTLQSAVRFIGKVKDKERWDYWIENDNGMTLEQKAFVEERGLKILLGPPLTDAPEGHQYDYEVYRGPKE
ncbi:hypothetical protein KY325_00510 [Candidatus Woesearchaeota archaeon]|nr:hypothetical protein [Candidatus Woesearchaeota archaeon]MBW3017625.1 hypothetical protein [Candidatus Woesearchaeota archaeon]